MSIINFSIPKDSIAVAGEQGVVATISIGNDVVFTATLIREDDGSLYYHLFDEADLDGAFVIEGHLPEYFGEELVK